MTDDLEELARTRDPDLRGVLAVRHLPLVKFVARRLASNLPAHIDMDDLVSYGTLGLLDALDKFEPHRGHRFSTYAVTRIRGAILDGLQQMDWAPKQVTSRVRTVRRLREVMAVELNRFPTEAEMAERLGVATSEIRAALLDDRVTKVHSYDVPLGDDPFQAVSGPESQDWETEMAGEISELRSRVSTAVTGLGLREAAVLTLYYRDGLTLRQIAERLGVSVSSATQTHTHHVESVRERLAALGGVAC